MLKKVILSILLVLISLGLFSDKYVFADSDVINSVPTEIYSVYDDDFNLLFQKDFLLSLEN